MMRLLYLPLVFLVAFGLLMTQLAGCEALVGGAAVGGAYEYTNKRSLDDLDRRYKAGEISRGDYLREKKTIEEGSVVY